MATVTAGNSSVAGLGAECRSWSALTELLLSSHHLHELSSENSPSLVLVETCVFLGRAVLCCAAPGFTAIRVDLHSPGWRLAVIFPFSLGSQVHPCSFSCPC